MSAVLDPHYCIGGVVAKFSLLVVVRAVVCSGRNKRERDGKRESNRVASYWCCDEKSTVTALLVGFRLQRKVVRK